jgi:lipopolysaccharide transport system ATP-binding protein
MSDDVLVRVENVSKRFCRSLKRSLWYGLQDLGSEIGGSRHGGGRGLPQSSADVQLRPDEFWAVKDVSFELRRGECLGLIGRNGAGKTTLLKMLNGLIKPDTGWIDTKGRVGALIALGAGFNPLLSGYENIDISLSLNRILGSERSLKRDQIIEFSGLAEFLEAPVQSYSSGMNAKLGFACAIVAQPDILIIDEVLAVGDFVFRSKCFDYISSILDRTAIIFVSHSSPQLSRITTSSLLLKNGSVVYSGQTGIALQKFLHLDDKLRSESLGCFVHNNLTITLTPILGDSISINAEQDLLLSLSLKSSSIERCNIFLNFLSSEQQPVMFTSIHDISLSGNERLTLRLLYPRFPLQPGVYTIAVNVLSSDNRKQLAWVQHSARLVIGGKSEFRSHIRINPIVDVVNS